MVNGMLNYHKEIFSGMSKNASELSTVANPSSVGSVGSAASVGSSFESLLLRIREQLGYEFPNAAVVELPLIISKETQDALIRLEQESGLEVAEKAILTAIDKINRGALETVDKLIRDNLSVSGVSTVSAVDTAVNTAADATDATVNMISEA